MSFALTIQTKNGKRVDVELTDASALDGVPYQIFTESDGYLVAMNRELFNTISRELMPFLDPHGIAGLIEAWTLRIVDDWISVELDADPMFG